MYEEKMEILDELKLPSEIINKIMLYNSHPCADFIKVWLERTVPWVPTIAYLGYCGFTPLTECGSNGRKIHMDYEQYLKDYDIYSDSEADC